MNKIAFTVDLDDWYHTPLITGANFSYFETVDDFFDQWEGEYDFITEPCLRLLEILDEFNITATFFVIADEVERYPELMKKLKESPHEIAHHSLHHTVPIDTKTKELRQTKEEWEAELIEAKDILESYFERPIEGYRAPGAYFADWMIPILIKHGFKYDSSMVSNSLYNKSNRILDSFPKTPFKLNEHFEVARDNEPSIIEIPWVGKKIGKWHLPAGGAFFFRLLGAPYFLSTFRQHLKLGDGVFYLHAFDINDKKFPMSNWRHRPFYFINKGKRTEKQLIKFLKGLNGHFCSCNDLIS